MLRKILIVLIGLGVYASANETANRVIKCEPELAYKCTKEKCTKIKVVNIDGVQSFEIDPDKKTMVGRIGNTQIDIEHIVSRHASEETFVFFGTHADSLYDWVIRIDKKSNEMVLLSTDVEHNAFSIFGTCTWEAER